MKQAWEWLKTNIKLVLSVLGTIAGYVLLKQYFQGDLKAKLKNADTKAQDAVLEERKSNIENDRAAEEARANELRNQLGKSNTNQEDSNIINFYKKK